MTGPPTLVLLPGFRDPAGFWSAVQSGLSDDIRSLAPPLTGTGSSDRFTLSGAAAGVAGALAAAGLASATVCGVGLGAMVALQLAVDAPERVADLVLITRQVQRSPLLLSLPAAVLPLLPATVVARLGVGQDQVLSLLNQVRPVDFGPLAKRLTAPALVVCGERDVANRRTSAVLAREIPRGDLQSVPGAGPGWLRDSPLLLVDVLHTRLLG